MILLQIKCICSMLINNNKRNNNKLPYLHIVGVYMNMLSLKIHLSWIFWTKFHDWSKNYKIVWCVSMYLCMLVTQLCPTLQSHGL